MLYQFDPASGWGHDPEGLLSTLPAIATTLIGVRAGQWLRDGEMTRLSVGALIALLLAYAWSHWLPLNKNLWTSSYVLWTAGWAMLALVVCHILFDVKKWPAVGRRFGVNAIAAYVGSAAMVYVFAALGWWEPIYRVGFSDWMSPRFGPFLPSLVFALAFVACWWLVLYWMDRKRWYLKL
jgi:predicted acyltransferase